MYLVHVHVHVLASCTSLYMYMHQVLPGVVGITGIGYYKRDSEVRSALKAAEMGLKLRGARDVDVGMLGSLGVDQGERPNNIGCC